MFWKMENKKKESIVLFGVLIVLLVFIVAKLLSVITYDIPQEFREATLPYFAQCWADGINLYSKETLEWAVPAATSVYGFLIPLILAPFVKIGGWLGISALQTCQFLTWCVEIVGVWIAYKAVILKTKDRICSLGAAVMVYACYWRYSAFGGAFPDQWGMTLMMFLMWTIAKDDSRKKIRPLLYASIVVVLYFIKQYFVFCGAGVVIYLLARSWRDALKFCVIGGCLGIVCLLGSYFLFPLYLAESLPNAQGSSFDGGWEYSLSQIWELASSRYSAVSLLFIVGLVISLVDRTDRKNRLASFEMCMIVGTLPLLAKMACNIGTYWTYYTEMWWPFVVISAFVAISRMNQMYFVKRHTASLVFVVAVVVVSVLQASSFLFERQLSSEEYAEWREAYSVLDSESKKGEILVSPHLADYCIKHRLATPDYGQAEYNDARSLGQFEGKRMWRTLFPVAGDILRKQIAYNKQIKENVKQRRYSCIALSKYSRYEIDEQELKDSGYGLYKTLVLKTGNDKEQAWETKFYIPLR